MLVICTPTGQIGRQVLANVLDAGVPVRVIARDAARLTPQPDGRYEVVEGSLTDVGAVTEAFAGADTVFWLYPPDPSAADITERTLEFTRVLCEAATKQNVRRLVYVGGLGHEAPMDTDRSGRAMDRLIAETGLSYRTLRMPAFMDNILWQLQPIKHQGMFFYPIDGDRKLPTCATRDIAAAATRLLLDPTWRGRDYLPVLGPEDLSYHEMARIMSEVLDRPIHYQQVPAEGYRANLIEFGQSEAAAQWLVDLLVAIDQGLYNQEPRTPESTTPTTFRQWCEEVLKPAVLS